MILFIIPKNSGLVVCKDISKKYSGEVLEVRGEDVPLFVFELIRQGKKVIGITGEDLLKEFLLENKNTGLEIIEVIKWDDPSCIFGKPTLCLLGDKNKKFEEIDKKVRVCINKKYSRIAKKYLSRLEDGGYCFEKLYLSGATESSFVNGLVDLVIDIVYSGKSASEAGLAIYDKIFSSDIVIIGERRYSENGE